MKLVLQCFRRKNFHFVKNSEVIVKGCWESKWWKRRPNKTNRSQYGANTSVKWCFFLQCCRTKGFDFTKSSLMIVEGCCESKWWRRGDNKTNRTQYGANIIVKWCLFLQCCRSKAFDFTENYKMIVEGCCESNWWRRGHNKTNRTQYGANTSVMWCFFCSALEQKVLILWKIQNGLWKAVVNQKDEEEETTKQIGPNMVLTPE